MASVGFSMVGSGRCPTSMVCGPWKMAAFTACAPWLVEGLSGSGGVDLEGGGAGAGLLEVVDDAGVAPVLGPVAGVREGEVGLVVDVGEGDVVGGAPGGELPGARAGGGSVPVGGDAVGGADEHPVAV